MLEIPVLHIKGDRNSMFPQFVMKILLLFGLLPLVTAAASPITNALYVNASAQFFPKIPYRFAENKNYWEGIEYCSSLGPQWELASIHSLEENLFIWDHLTLMYPNAREALLGARKSPQSGQFEWLDGSPWNYKRWGFKQPDNSGDCLHMILDHNLAFSEDESGNWNDGFCFFEAATVVCKFVVRNLEMSV